MKLKLRSSWVGGVALFGAGVAWACSSPPPPLGGDEPSSGGSAGTAAAMMGQLGGPCYGNNTCDANLVCTGGICLPSSGAPQGSLGGVCYSNNTCDSGLSCVAGYCLPGGGVAGAAGSNGAAGASGSSSTAGASGSSSTAGASGSSSTAGASGSSSTAGASGSSSTAGASGSSSTAGASGSSTAGASGSAGAGGTPTNQIIPFDGWVATGSNTIGIVGPFYTFLDPTGTSTITPAPMSDWAGEGSDVCLSGNVYQNGAYGPTLGFNLYQPEDALDPLTYTPSAHGLTGFSFDISASTLPSAIQFSYLTSTGAEYCKVLYPPKATGNVVTFASATQNCWTGTGAALSSSTALTAIHFQVPVNYYANGQSYNFCIVNFKGI